MSNKTEILCTKTEHATRLLGDGCVCFRADSYGIPLAPKAGVVSHFSLGAHASVRVELEALSPDGPYRLQIDHPAKRTVEYFETLLAALDRHAEVESALSGWTTPPDDQLN